MPDPVPTPSAKEPRTAILGLAAGYASVYAMLIPIAREHGYALAVHGSLNRDLDLVAIPWAEAATDPLTLIQAIKQATGTVTHGTEIDQYYPDCHPTQKPFGRLAYSLHFTERGCEGTYMDISVYPRYPANQQARADLLP